LGVYGPYRDKESWRLAVCVFIATSAKGLTMEALQEMEQIVYSGTKLNIKYWVDEMLDDEQQEEIHDYFMVRIR
jgi:hypothetical protein